MAKQKEMRHRKKKINDIEENGKSMSGIKNTLQENLNQTICSNLSGPTQGAHRCHNMNRLYPSQFPFLVQYVCTLQYLLSVGAEHALYSEKINVNVRTSSRKADNIVSNIVIMLYKITVHLHCPNHVTPKCMTNTRLYKQLNLCCISPWITLTSSALLKRLS